MLEGSDGRSKGARANNRRRVLDLLRQHRSLSQADIGRLTDLSRATVSDLLRELRGRGLAREVGTQRSTSGALTGRPPNVFSLNDSIGSIVGIEFDHSYVRTAVANLGLEVLVGPEREFMNVADNAVAAMKAAATMVDAMLAKAQLARADVIGVGISLPAPIRRDPTHPDRSTVAATTILSDWVGRRPAKELHDLLGLPVVIDNDANLSALAEVDSGAATGCAQVIYIKASTGIGCGLVMYGRLYRGAIGTAGELAHVVVAPHGSICYCGNRGCLHTVVGGDAIMRMLQSSDVGPLLFSAPSHPRRGGGYDEHLAQVIKAAEGGDRACRTALRDAAEELGVAVAGLCNVLNPERVVIGGVLGTAGDLVFPPLTKAVENYTSSAFGDPVGVVPGLWKEEAEVRGAMALVRWESSAEITDRLQHLGEEASRLTRPSRSVTGRRSAARRRESGPRAVQAH